MTGVVTLTALAAPLAGAALGGLYLAFDLAVLPALARPAVRVGGGDGEPAARAAETMRAINVGPWRRAHRVRTAAGLAAAVLGAAVGLETSGAGAS